MTGMLILLRGTAGRRRRVPAAVLSAALGVLLMSPQAARAGYAVGTGDVVEVRIRGVSDFPQKAQVQPDGTVSFSGIGDVKVGGLTLAEMRARIGDKLAATIFRQHLPDGQLGVVAVQPEDVSVEIAEYRPVYVSGDVLNPGQYAYRPGLTVRQAVALCGGYSFLRSRQLGSGDVLELQGQYASLTVQLIKEQIHAVRLRAELDGAATLAAPAFDDATVPRSTVTELLRLEAEALKVSIAAYQQEKASISDSMVGVDQEIATLTAQQAQEAQGLQADQQDLDRATKAFGNGSLPSPRVTESRRAVMASTTKRLETIASLMQLKLQRSDLTEKLRKLDDGRRLDLLNSLSQSSAQVAELRDKLVSLRDRMGMLASTQRLAASRLDNVATVEIVRDDGQGAAAVLAKVDTELQPGDVVTLHLKTTLEQNGGLPVAGY